LPSAEFERQFSSGSRVLLAFVFERAGYGRGMCVDSEAFKSSIFVMGPLHDDGYIVALLRPVAPPASIHSRSFAPMMRGWLPM
jgi:hypothetical protein